MPYFSFPAPATSHCPVLLSKERLVSFWMVLQGKMKMGAIHLGANNFILGQPPYFMRNFVLYLSGEETQIIRLTTNDRHLKCMIFTKESAVLSCFAQEI